MHTWVVVTAARAETTDHRFTPVEHDNGLPSGRPFLLRVLMDLLFANRIHRFE